MEANIMELRGILQENSWFINNIYNNNNLHTSCNPYTAQIST